MTGKSLVTSLITMGIAFLGAYSGLLSPAVQAWAGAIAMLLTAVLNSPIFMSAGSSWPKGWKWSTWVTAGLGIVTLWLSQMGDTANPLISVAVINGIIAGVNIFLTTFIKAYEGSPSSLGGTR